MWKGMLLPPGMMVLLGILGVLLFRRFRRLGTALLMVAATASYLLSIPVVAKSLQRSLEVDVPPTDEAIRAAQPTTIVVLGGGYRERAPEYGGGPTLHERTLARVRYAAWLHRKTGLPILASGGSIDGKTPEAEVMAAVLKQEFRIDEASVFAESASRTTWENALNSARILKERNDASILLVTTAIHLPRAVEAFETQGLKVLPAPTLYADPLRGAFSFESWVPSMTAIHEVHFASYELIGRLWYRLRHE